MAWVVDTCLVLDVLDADPDFGPESARLLDRRFPQGLVVCPVSFVELAPAFGGNLERQRYFLAKVGIGFEEGWQDADTLAAHAAWQKHVAQRRAKTAAKRPVADILIGAFALRFRGLLTRNSADFRGSFPDLTIVEP